MTSNRSKTPSFKKHLVIILLILFGLFSFSTLGIILFLFHYEPVLPQNHSFSDLGSTHRLADGRVLGYLEAGDSAGFPVFYLHGGPGSRLEVLIYDQLAQGHNLRLIGVDRPGYGLSNPQPGRTYRDFASDLESLADHLGFGAFSVIGWSSGGPYAAAVAHFLPQRVYAAGLVASEGPYRHPEYPGEVLQGESFNGSGLNEFFLRAVPDNLWAMEGALRAMRIAVFSGPKDFMLGSMDDAGGVPMNQKDLIFYGGELAELQALSFLEAFRTGIDGVFDDFRIEREPYPFEFSDIQGPSILVVHGREDYTVDYRLSLWLAEMLDQDPLLFPEEGHSVLYYQFDQIAPALLP
jgi:pimeloyl-ACP methyl ester carboxylesterase